MKTWTSQAATLGITAAACAGVALAAVHVRDTYTLTNSQGQPAGTVSFTQKNSGPVKVKIELTNLPIGVHGVHIHANPSCTAPDFKDAGGHWNPTTRQHGFDNPMGHHLGDIPGNVTVGEDHKGEATFELKDVTLTPGQFNSIPGNGLAFVVHAGADDMKTDPSGASGNRIACAVITAGPATPTPPTPPTP